MKRHIVLAGGTGFLGTTLANHFKGQGWDVTILTRGCGGDRHGVRRVHWERNNAGPMVP
jgi:nucleoside-diphosphate-sugar epimerase